MRAAKMTERPSFQLMVQTDVQSIYHMQMPRWLFSDPRYCEMSLDAKVTYTFLLNRFQLSRRNGWVNERGEVFVIFPRKVLAKELRICEQRVTAAFKKLVELELVWEKRCGRGDANQIYLAYVTPQDDSAYQRTGSTRRYHPGYECKWATNTVVHLLENREYTGCLVNFKTEKPSYKMKHSIDNPIEKQAIFENHHEPIIDLQTWERVQELRKQRKRPNRYDDVGLFSGLLFCADCGHVMYQQRYQTDKRKQDCYICGSYKKRTADCTAHFIRTDLLTAGVLDNLRKVTAYAQKHEARFVKLLIQQNEMGGKRKLAAAAKQLEQVQSRIAELSRYIKRLYEDNVNGKISDERFMEMSADYEAEQRELKDRAAALQGELDKAQEATVNAEKFMSVVRKYLSIEELTHTLLREMVEKIVVYECEYDENEVRRQRIDIYYSFVGKIDLPEE